VSTPTEGEAKMQRDSIACAKLGISAIFSAISLISFTGSARADFILGGGEDYAILFEGAGGNTLQVTNTTINGNVGVGNTGQMTDSGPSTINGRIDFSAADTGQFHNNNQGNIITGGVHYNIAAVTSALNWVNSLSQMLYGDAGTSVAINGNTTVNASSGTIFIVNGQAVHVFDATSFHNSGGQTLTINGSATDLVAINLDGLGNIQFHGGITFTGGIGLGNVLFNLGGGDYVHNTGAPSLDINNNGGTAGIARGIFLDPNGAMDVTNGVVFGHVFGGDSHDFQFVSGANITVPEPSTLCLLGLGAIGVLLRRSKR
jgi:PEP-CTERM motif-containing protein